MKRTTSYEPDLLPAFRTFAVLWLALMSLVLLTGALIDNAPHSELPRRWMHVVSAGILVAYLYAPHLQQRLAGLYLPLAVGIATVGPLLILSLPLNGDPTAQINEPLQLLLTVARLFVIWVVVVVMLGWAYDLRTVWGFSLGMVSLNLLFPWLLDRIPEDFLLDYAIFSLFVAVAFALVGYLVNRLSTAERNQRRELAQANEQLVQYANTLENLTISRERNRIARELHDTLAHTLSGLAVQLETAKAYMDADADTAKSLLEQALTATRTGLQETRHALQSLRAAPLDDLGLRMALIQLGESAAQRTGARLVVDMAEDVPTLSPAIEQTIYRTAQEAIANAVKHATAQTLTLKLRVTGTIHLIVADDGVGFEADSVAEDGHYGLVGMQERAALVGGTVTVTSQPGHGTQVELTIEPED